MLNHDLEKYPIKYMSPRCFIELFYYICNNQY